MFDNVYMTENQRKDLENNIDNLSINGIHGIITISEDFIETKNEDDSFTLIDGVITYTLHISEDKYKKAITITDRKSILFSLAPISVVVGFQDKGIRDDF